MAGTKEGGLKTKATLLAKYGEDFYRETGKKGGAGKHKPGAQSGFAADRELARVAGRKGGRLSKRGMTLKKGTIEPTWVTKPSSASSRSTTKTSHNGTCLECGRDRVFYKRSRFCQQCYRRLGKLGRGLVMETQEINRGEKSNNYETVTVPGWRQVSDKPEFIIEPEPSLFARLFGRRHRR